MRINLFHPSFETVGGAEILAAEQACFLLAAGHQVKVVTLGYDPERWQDRFRGMQVEVVPKRHWTDALGGWSRIGKLRARGARASRHLRGADVVLAYNHPCNAMLGAARPDGKLVWQCNEPPRGLHMKEANPNLFKRILGEDGTAPWTDFASQKFLEMVTEHDAQLARRRSLYARREFDLTSTRNLDAIFAISEFSRDNARAIYGRCNEEVVYPAVRFGARTAGRRGLDRSGLGVLVHSRLEVFKNIDTVLRGFRLFKEKVDPGAHLHVVGEGPEKARLKVLAKDLLPGGGVTFHGYLPLDELNEVYAACDVFALLPLDEPFGMVIPEAISRGLTVIGPSHGGPREILEDGRFGQVIDAFSPEALLEAFERVWSSSDEVIERDREVADASCRARFSPSVVMPALLRALT